MNLDEIKKAILGEVTKIGQNLVRTTQQDFQRAPQVQAIKNITNIARPVAQSAIKISPLVLNNTLPNKNNWKIIEPIGKFVSGNDNFSQSPTGQLLQGNFLQAAKRVVPTLQDANNRLNSAFKIDPITHKLADPHAAIDYSFQGVVSGMGPTDASVGKVKKIIKELEPTVKLLKNRLTSEDVHLLGKFGALVEKSKSQANRANMGDVGIQMQTFIEAAFGKKAANWTNKEVNNAINYVLRRIAEGENKAGLGLSINDVSGAFKKSSNLNTNPFPWEVPGFKASEKPNIQINTQPGDINVATGMGGIPGSVDKIVKQDFADWVNQRKATKVEGFLKRKEFSDLDTQGIEGIFKFQEGEKTGRFADVKLFFDKKRKEVIDTTGREFGYKQDYLPQIWADPEDVVQQVYANSLNKSAPFTMQSLIKDYQEGINAGLTPKYRTLGELVGWYETRANKLIADTNYFKRLAKDSLIVPGNRAPREWVTINPDRFPKINVETEGGSYNGIYKAPPELAKMINNYLSEPDGALHTIANFVSGVKNRALSFGIPGTAINAHGINILARHTLFGTGGNPISRLFTGGKYIFNQAASNKALDKELSAYGSQAVRAGLSLSTEVENNIMRETLRNKFGNAWNQAFEKPLFDKMIPALKLSSWKELVKNGMESREAAKLVNNVYGGINWEAAGRNRSWQDAARVVFLAPDWGETSLRLGGNFVKAFNPKASGKVVNRYRTMMTTLAASYIAVNIANKLTSGHYAYENDPGHTFEIESGYTPDGEKRYIRPYGTAADMIRIPVDTAVAIARGDLSSIPRTIRNRLSMPAGVGVGLLTDTDYRGKPIGYKGKDQFGNTMPIEQRISGIAGEASSLFGVPSVIRQLGDSVTGKQSLEAGIVQGFELPFRYSGAGSSKVQQFVGDISGLHGKDLYDLKTKFRGESQFSKNQKKIIQEGGLPALDAVMQQRNAKRQANQIKEIQEKVLNGELSSEEAQKVLNNLLSQPNSSKNQTRTNVNKAYAANGTYSSADRVSWINNTSVQSVDLTPYKKIPITIVAKAKLDSKKYSDAIKILNSPLNNSEKNEAFKKMGLSIDDVTYYDTASQKDSIKSLYVTEELKNISGDRQSLFNKLTEWRKSVNDKMILSNKVIDDLVDQEIITKEEGSTLKKFSYSGEKGKYRVKMTGRGTGAKLKKISFDKFKKPTGTKIKLSFIGNTPRVKSLSSPRINMMSNINFDTPFSPNSNIPSIPNFKTKIKFNL